MHPFHSSTVITVPDWTPHCELQTTQIKLIISKINNESVTLLLLSISLSHYFFSRLQPGMGNIHGVHMEHDIVFKPRDKKGCKTMGCHMCQN